MSRSNGSCGNSNHLHLIKSEQDCKHCQSEKLCLAFGLGQEAVSEFKGIIKERGPYAAGDTIYRQQDQFRSLYSIQSGSIKTETVTADGRQSVMGFYLIGDLLGIDAIGGKTYPNDAIAMETTWVCEIPYKSLLNLFSGQPYLQQQFINRLGGKIHADEYSGKVIRNESATRRVMHFLYQLYWHQARDKGPTSRLHLPMSKQDLASFLGLTPESFSRTLTQLQKQGHIEKESHKVIVLLKTPPSAESGHIEILDIK
ncbi:Crp/Fnr family transcriptional regulator [Motiliproteus sp. MSK22-1]|uniref:Crp/Fnr family transcriptional regulator n=1 Tax=Motiliproteus sp. MSK22-1 TaxID=1897630 RepID=UPI000975412F|nr:helix-turn-helix domain-containing protein [Motiliproteus sp. MSK22-1]OMH29493.1 hypothetical protein BGP75_19820 [Motiliproteus sp. MSK22-1]